MTTIKDRFVPPSKSDAEAIRRMMAFMDTFRQLDASMPASYVAAFLAVAFNPGHGVTHYAKEMGVVVPVASRILLEIGKRARSGGPGHGLVDSVQASADLRAWSYYLTPKGTKMLDRLFHIMRN